MRRWRDSSEALTVVCAASDPAPVLARFVGLPQIVAVVEQSERRAVGVTVEGVPLELVVAAPAQFGTALLRATGAPAYVEALEPLPDAPDEEAVYRALEVPGCRRSYARSRSAASRRRSWSWPTSAATCTCTPRGPTGGRACSKWAAPGGPRLRVHRDLRPHARGGRRARANARRRAPPGRGDRGRERGAGPFRILRGIECDILPDGRLDLPDDVLAELDWVQASVHGGQRMPRREMTKRVEEALRNPYVSCLSHPKGRIINRRPENALDLERVYEVAVEEGVALEVNGLPDRLDLRAEHVRDALQAGVEIVCSTDTHSVRGLENMVLSVMTARRGWATADQVVNTRPMPLTCPTTRISPIESVSCLPVSANVTEKAMFGGLAFLVGGNMAVAASGQGGLMVRVDPEATDALVAKPHARPFEMRGREIDGAGCEWNPRACERSASSNPG